MDAALLAAALLLVPAAASARAEERSESNGKINGDGVFNLKLSYSRFLELLENGLVTKARRPAPDLSSASSPTLLAMRE